MVVKIHTRYDQCGVLCGECILPGRCFVEFGDVKAKTRKLSCLDW